MLLCHRRRDSLGEILFSTFLLYSLEPRIEGSDPVFFSPGRPLDFFPHLVPIALLPVCVIFFLRSPPIAFDWLFFPFCFSPLLQSSSSPFFFLLDLVFPPRTSFFFRWYTAFLLFFPTPPCVFFLLSITPHYLLQ